MRSFSHHNQPQHISAQPHGKTGVGSDKWSQEVNWRVKSTRIKARVGITTFLLNEDGTQLGLKVQAIPVELLVSSAA